MATLQLGFGQSSADEGSAGGPIVGEAVIWPLRGVTVTTGPSRGPDVTCWGGGLFPPGFTHCKTAEPPSDDRNTSDTTLPNPAALKWAVRLASGFFMIIGVRIKCGLCARASGAVVMTRTNEPMILGPKNILQNFLIKIISVPNIGNEITAGDSTQNE